MMGWIGSPRAQVTGPNAFSETCGNRIVHHEPIFARDLAADHRHILDVAGWMSPETAVWIRYYSRVPDVLAFPGDAEEIRFRERYGINHRRAGGARAGTRGS